MEPNEEPMLLMTSRCVKGIEVQISLRAIMAEIGGKVALRIGQNHPYHLLQKRRHSWQKSPKHNLSSLSFQPTICLPIDLTLEQNTSSACLPSWAFLPGAMGCKKIPAKQRSKEKHSWNRAIEPPTKRAFWSWNQNAIAIEKDILRI